ncbi:IS66 family transposase, partial [Bradyrhizobium australafricanum]|uniref:IS66 family transposase n=1 Tax=Bradyrhizobium australafricanum TaxID=2821406 RepID=UPI0040630ECB
MAKRPRGAQARSSRIRRRASNDIKARNADADTRIERLTQILKAFDRARFGRRSEKLGTANGDDEQQAFVFEEIETGIAAIKAQVSKGREQADGKRAPRRRKGFAPHLERIETVIEPEELAEHAGKQKVLIGEDVSERLDVVPAKFRVIVTRRPRYAFKNADGVIQAPAPAHIIEGGIPTEALLAQIAVAKYADGLPLYRQEAICARDHVELDRQLMAQWMGKLGFELEIVADYIFSEVKKAERVFADETTLPTLAPGSGSTKMAYLWTYARDGRTFGRSGPPMVAYRFEDSRAGECAVRHLNGYRGILQVDGYAAYNKLARSDRGKDGITLAGCRVGGDVAIPAPGHRRRSPAPGSHRTWRADFPHRRSSTVGSQHRKRLQLPIRKAQLRLQQRCPFFDLVEGVPSEVAACPAAAAQHSAPVTLHGPINFYETPEISGDAVI